MNERKVFLTHDQWSAVVDLANKKLAELQMRAGGGLEPCGDDGRLRLPAITSVVAAYEELMARNFADDD